MKKTKKKDGAYKMNRNIEGVATLSVTS